MTRWQVVGAALLVCGLAGNVHAQASRTWVSGVGDDANPCSRTAPCKTFAGAISKTAAGGEIDVLDPGGYGAVTITKAITIDGGHGSGWASILASGTNGIIVAAAATDVVKLRNLSINGGPNVSPGLIGIKILSAKDVYVEDSTIFGFMTTSPSGRGISDVRTNAGRLFVTDCIIRHNGHTGVVMAPSVGQQVSGIFKNVQFEGNGAGGLALTNGAHAHVDESSAFGNINAGFYADGLGAASHLVVERSVSSHNGTGVTSQSGATVVISDVTITVNTSGITTPSGGVIYSYGNNRIDANGTNGSPTFTIVMH